MNERSRELRISGMFGQACSFDSAALYGSGGLGTALYRALQTTPAGEPVDLSIYDAVARSDGCAVLTSSSGTIHGVGVAQLQQRSTTALRHQSRAHLHGTEARRADA